jgi:hypothetical protein
MTGICTECGLAIEPHTSVLAGIEAEGKLSFRWACDHHPVGDAAVILASNDCVVSFVAKHPEYEAEILILLGAKKC